MENNLIPTIDQHLKSNYHAICFNPERAQTLKRMSHQYRNSISHLSSPSSSAHPSQTFIDNNLVNKYIHFVYDKYNIEDPIDKEMRLGSQQDIKGLPPMEGSSVGGLKTP